MPQRGHSIRGAWGNIAYFPISWASANRDAHCSRIYTGSALHTAEVPPVESMAEVCGALCDVWKNFVASALKGTYVPRSNYHSATSDLALVAVSGCFRIHETCPLCYRPRSFDATPPVGQLNRPAHFRLIRFQRQYPSTGASLARTSSITSFGQRPSLSARRAFQSTLFRWSARMTPVAPWPTGTATSNG